MSYRKGIANKDKDLKRFDYPWDNYIELAKAGSWTLTLDRGRDDNKTEYIFHQPNKDSDPVSILLDRETERDLKLSEFSLYDMMV